jgi:hypothetical protein
MRQDRSFHEDFNEWAALARSDPRAFEALRREKVQLLIERAPANRRRRLQALQWRIDQERSRAPSPLEACRRLSGMMWDSVLGKGGLLESLRAPRRSEEAAPSSCDLGPGSNVLRFPGKP